MLRIYTVLLVVALSTITAFDYAQSPIDGGISAQDCVRRMRADMSFLTSEAMDGRTSLRRPADAAAAFIAAEFTKAGLRPIDGDSHLQKFDLIEYSSDPRRLRLAIRRGGAITEFQPVTDFNGSFFDDVAINAPLVFAGYGITAPQYRYDDYEGIDARGKVVLIIDHEPQENSTRSVFNGAGHTVFAGRRHKVLNAQAHGAVAVLVAPEPNRRHRFPLDPIPPRFTNPRIGSVPTQTLGDVRTPAFNITEQTATILLGTALPQLQDAIDASLRPASKSLEPTVVELRAATAERRRGQTANVIGILDGADPVKREETVLLMSHYDHLLSRNGTFYPGANDNGSGTVAVIELARLLARSPQRPSRSIVFISFGAEEEGLLGSYFYVANPVQPLAGTVAAINLDMIGRNEGNIPQTEELVPVSADTTNELNLIGTYLNPELRRVIDNANKIVGLNLSDKYDADSTQNALFRCDHFPFLMAGVPAVWFFGGWHPGYHEPSDTVEKVDFSKLERVMRLAQLSTVALANR
jgi:Peptidase family M28/PA domain